MTKDQQ